MSQGFYTWSHTASANATADSSINWAEGQAPSSVNDSSRAVMARASEYRDDMAGAIVTGGSSTAYTVGSFQVFDSLAHLNGQAIAFTPHTANGATVTLNVDSLGAKPLRTAPNVELQTNVLIQGTPYLATYNNSDGVFYLNNLASNTYGIPLGAGMDYWLSTTPSSAYAFPTGQAISRTTYATLFSAMGTTYGVGDGTTTFNLPDKTGRVSAMVEASATRLTSTYFGGNSTVLGAVGGLESQTLSLGQLPTGITSTGSISVTSTTSVFNGSMLGMVVNNGSNVAINYGASGGSSQSTAVNSTGTPTLTSNNTSGNPHNNVQPTICCKYILRVI